MLATRRRRLVALAGAVVAAVVLFVVVTAFTGLPGPGPLRRYRASQLEEMVDAIHAVAGPLRTPDDCWRTLEPDYDESESRPIATIDWVRSRVVVGLRADIRGRVSPATRRAVEDRLADVVADHPGLSSGMLELEASPEGWSPMVDCRAVVRGFLGP
ncbi:MAG TPA: hypothetical protein VIY72_13815 [Acidimicrobiales bacterium]